MRIRRPRFMGRAPRVPSAGMNLIPLVDLALNLVLIMLVMAPAMYMVRLPVKLPEAKTADSNTKEWIRLTYSSDGRVSVNGDEPASLNALPAKLVRARKEAKQDAFLLEIDRAVPFYQTSRILDILRKTTPRSRIAIATVPVIPTNAQPKPN